jgi:hypothetical protein
MAKKRGRTGGGEFGEELIAGVPLRRVQEFLCHHEGREWFNIDWLDAWRLVRSEDKAERSRALERLAREMLARGWIEKVASKSTTLQADSVRTPLRGRVSTPLQVACGAKRDQT